MEDAEALVFLQGDQKTSVCRSIAAVCVPLFLQGIPECGKTDAVRHFSPRNPVYSVSCGSVISIEQFIGCHLLTLGMTFSTSDSRCIVLGAMCWQPTGEWVSGRLLLVGPASFKTLALEFLLPQWSTGSDMSRETQICELIR
jgi:hypothetical protein